MRLSEAHELRRSNQKTAEIAQLKPIWQYIKPYKWQLALAIISLFITSSSVLGIGKGLGYLVDKGLAGKDPHLLNVALVILLAVTFLLALGSYARFYFITYVGENVVADIRRDLYKQILKLSAEFYESTKTGDILSRMTVDTSLIQMVVGSSLSIALRNTLMFLGGIGLLMHTSFKLTLIVCLFIPIVVFPIIFLGRKLRGLSREAQEKIGAISSHAEESINGIKTIQSFVREKLEQTYFARFVDDALKASLDRTKLRSMLTAIVIMVVFGSVGFVLWIGGQDVLAGKMSGGQLSSFIFYSVVVAGSLGAISEVVGDLQRAAGATERMLGFLQLQPSVQDPISPLSLPRNVGGNISFDKVTFNYPAQKERSAIKDFSLDIKSGETIALAGHSGAGKSTIFQLLLRFYDVSKGDIKIDGVSIQKLMLSDLRGLFGMVPQDPIIFSATAYENILFGNPDASESQVRDAAKAAAALEFIEKLPQGFNSFLGEKGVRLSGGEKQRIAIARTFLKDPKILLLDEATSALDMGNEKLVQEAFERLKKHRTTIIIAHRLSTIQNADRIIVLDNGHIAEIGTHKELLKKKGIYANLVKTGAEA